MKRPWAALGLVLALSVIMPRQATAQGSKAKKPTLGQNYPNPFNPETFIQFEVGDFPNCLAEPSRMHTVTLKIYNLILDLVAIPVLKGSAGGVNGGTPLNQVSLPCGQYLAYWDGKVRSNGREAASGIYPYALTVDGQTTSKKAIAAK